jgi:hypothetical protein
MDRFPGSRMANLLSLRPPILKVRHIVLNKLMVVKQNTAIAGPARTRPAAAGRPSFNQQASTTSIETTASIDNANATMKGSVGLSSALSKAVLLRVRVATGADVHYTTTISVYVTSPWSS